MSSSPDKGSAKPLPLGKVSKTWQPADLVDADRHTLQDAWFKVFGRRPPVRLSRELLILALSYHSQSGMGSGLRTEELEQLGLANPNWIAGGSSARSEQQKPAKAQRSDPNPLCARLGAASAAMRSTTRPAPRTVQRSIKPGTRLLREWRGQTHEVIAESTGRFLYREETYRSLSAIARAITGTRWSGPNFFGIATKSQAQKTGGGGDA